jgi:hypothetical protein
LTTLTSRSSTLDPRYAGLYVDRGLDPIGELFPYPLLQDAFFAIFFDDNVVGGMKSEELDTATVEVSNHRNAAHARNSSLMVIVWLGGTAADLDCGGP